MNEITCIRGAHSAIGCFKKVQSATFGTQKWFPIKVNRAVYEPWSHI